MSSVRSRSPAPFSFAAINASKGLRLCRERPGLTEMHRRFWDDGRIRYVGAPDSFSAPRRPCFRSASGCLGRACAPPVSCRDRLSSSGTSQTLSRFHAGGAGCWSWVTGLAASLVPTFDVDTISIVREYRNWGDRGECHQCCSKCETVEFGISGGIMGSAYAFRVRYPIRSDPVIGDARCYGESLLLQDRIRKTALKKQMP
jgi:hypothetical protein